MDGNLPPGNTQKAPDNPALVNLREREKMLVEKLAGHNKADANAYLRQGFDIAEIKRRTESQLAEVRKEIDKLAK